MGKFVNVELRGHNSRGSLFLAVCRAGASAAAVGSMPLRAGPDRRPLITARDVARLIGAAANASPVRIHIFAVRHEAEIAAARQLAALDPVSSAPDEVGAGNDAEHSVCLAARPLAPTARTRPVIIDTPIASRALRTRKTATATLSDAK